MRAVKLPTRSVIARYERQAALDRQAIAQCGKLTVPAFCAAMARLLEAEERLEAVRKVAPLLVGA